MYESTILYVKSKALLNLSSENNRDRYQIITAGSDMCHIYIYTHLQFRIFNLVSLFVFRGLTCGRRLHYLSQMRFIYAGVLDSTFKIGDPKISLYESRTTEG